MFIAPQVKIARIFTIFTIAVLILTIFGLLRNSYRVTIILGVQPAEVEGTFTKIITIEKEGEETFAPKSLVTMEDYAKGEVIIINNSNQDQKLVAKTRLLSPDGLIFRLKNSILIPAKQRVKTTVQADQMGEKYDIGPTKFTIPGLSPILQEKIYAESKISMSGGIKKVGIVMQKDIDEARNQIKEKLLEEGLEEIKQNLPAVDIDKIAYQPEIIFFDSSTKPGEEKDAFTVKMTLKIAGILVNERNLLAQTEAELAKQLPADQKILNKEPKTFEYKIKNYNQNEQTATFELRLSGKSILSTDSEKLNKNKFLGLSSKEIKNYLLGIESVKDVKVKFSPFFLTKAPNSEKRIFIKIKPL